MSSPRTLIFVVLVSSFLLHHSVSGDGNAIESPYMMSLLTEKISEQIYSLGNLQFRALGSTPVEVGLKITLNALSIFTIASGSHLLITKKSFDQENQLTAITSANLCTNLPTLGEMYRAIINATLFTGGELLLDPSNANKAPERLFEILEQFVNNSVVLKDIYYEEKENVRQNSLPAVAEGFIDFKHIVPLQAVPTMLVMFSTYPRIRYFVVNTLFALWTNEELALGGMREHHLLAKSLVILSAESKNSAKVQKLFSEAIQRTATKLDPTTINFTTIMQIGEILDSTIRKVFSEDAEISVQLEDIMNAETRRQNGILSNITNE